MLDVMVAYTQHTRVARGASEMHALIDLALVETNDAYTASNVPIRLRLAHRVEVAYAETGESSVDLRRLKNPGDGHLDELHALRNAHGADLVVLLTEQLSACGRGYTMSSPSPDFESHAFSVVRIDCATGYFSFGHELGHNLGLAHDRANAGFQGATAYAYGWRFTGASGELVRTIMAYEPGRRIQRFSNPDVLYDGRPTGVAAGQPDAAHAALALRMTAPIAARFRTSVLCGNGELDDGEECDEGMANGGCCTAECTIDRACAEFSYHDLPPNRFPHTLALAADGSVWFTEEAWQEPGVLGRITPGGTVEHVTRAAPGCRAVSLAGKSLMGVTVARDQTVWFTTYNSLPGYGGNTIGRYNPGTGCIDEYTVPTAEAGPSAIIEGPDGNMCFTEYRANKIGRFDPRRRRFREWRVPTSNTGPAPGHQVEGPHDIVVGPDGALWFLEATANKLGRITTGGSIREFSIGTTGTNLMDLTVGPDGQIWFTEYLGNGENTFGNSIGSFDPATRTVTNRFRLPTPQSGPMQIVAAGGALWFTEHLADRIGRITPHGVLTEFPIRPEHRAPYGILAGRRGDVWFTEYRGSAIGRLQLGIGTAGDAESGCVAVREVACRQPIVAKKATLLIKDRAGRRSFAWKWSKGAYTTKAAFGDPLDGDGYTLNLFDHAGCVHSTEIAPGPGWSENARGFRYVVKSAAGSLKASLKAGEDGKATVQVAGSGAAMPPVPAPDTGPFLVQLVNDTGECWEATFSEALRHDESQYRAKSD